jgi:hypothetical protein
MSGFGESKRGQRFRPRLDEAVGMKPSTWDASEPGSGSREPYVDSAAWRLPYGRRLNDWVQRRFVTKWRQRAAKLVILFLVIWLPIIGLSLALTGKAFGF